MSANPMPRRESAGYTLIEMVITFTLVAIVAAIAIWVPNRARPRADLNAFTLEVMGILHQARQQALLDGNDVIVALFPEHANPLGGNGRLIIYENPDGAFFSAGRSWEQRSFSATSPASAGAGDSVIDIVDFPRTVEVALTWGNAFPAPLDQIPWNSSCTFCVFGNPSGGAIRFDSRGRARFYVPGSVTPLDVSGGSLTLASRILAGTNRLTPDIRTVAIWGSTGTAQFFTRSQEM